MYRTFEQALNDISGGKDYKNENYHMTRIRSLIKNGELTEGKPTELFVRDSSGEFVSIGRVKTEPLVTTESISEYVNARNSEISDRGCVTKGGKPIRAIFTDGSESEFLTMGDVVRFFCITRYQLRQALQTNRPISFPVQPKRADELDIDHEPELSEHIRFKYV
jgi:hypothetical protein